MENKILNGLTLFPKRYSLCPHTEKKEETGSGGSGGVNKLAAVVSGNYSTQYELTAADLAGCTKIKDQAFWSDQALIAIEIPEGVTEIGGSAFAYCYNLKSIILPNGLTTIRKNAFSTTGIRSPIFIPASVTEIGETAFFQTHASYFDFSTHTQIPTLGSSTSITKGYEIRVPAALYNEWKTATNWSNHVDYIVPV